MRIFVTGATGYIGGSVAKALADRGETVTGLTRSAEGAPVLEEAGISPIIGRLDEVEVLQAAAFGADATVHTAHADHSVAAQAILAAVEGTGKRMIHTSGSSIVGTAAMGELVDQVFDETAEYTPAPIRAARAALNLEVLGHAAFGSHTNVIAPAMIHGPGGLGGRESMQVPWLIETAIKHGGARHLGPGENRWANVHITDLVDLYLRVLDHAPAGAFYWAEAGEASMRELCVSINRMLGIDAAPGSMTPVEASVEWGEGPAIATMGSNSRVRAVRAREELGWAPFGPSIFEEIEQGHYARIWGQT